MYPTLQYILLTLPLFGTQIVWSFEFSYGTPVLLKRGFSPFLTTLVWLAGPLTGLVIQPLFGALSDNSVSRYGKRKPYIFAGWLATTGSMLLLVWDSSPFPILTAFVAFYTLDASLNMSMAAIRAHMVDSTGSDEQVDLNAWAGRMANLGNITGYLFSTLDFGFSDQVTGVLTIALILLTTTTATCFFYNPVSNTAESQYLPIADEEEVVENKTFGNIMKKFYTLAKNSRNEPQLVYLYKVQFFSWIAWFPILFYNSAWLSELVMQDCPTCTFDQIIRVASAGMMFFSVTSLTSSLLLPLLFNVPLVNENRRAALHGIWGSSQTVFSILTLAIFILSYMETMTYTIGALLITGLGISWSVTLWIPNTLLSEYTITKQPNDAGALLGLNNIFIVLPQFLSIGLCSAILWFTVDFTWIFLLAGLASLGSAVSCIS